MTCRYMKRVQVCLRDDSEVSDIWRDSSCFGAEWEVLVLQNDLIITLC